VISVNIVSGAPGDNEVSVRIDGLVVRRWRSSALRGDFDKLHAEAHRIAAALSGEFDGSVACAWCAARSGEGGVR
jgi:hypothetical protein